MRRPVLEIAALILTVGTVLSMVVEAFVLDVLAVRPPGAGSVTTMFPGLVYASATVAKVSIAAGLAAAVAAVLTRVSAAVRIGGGDGAVAGWPVCGLASLALTSSTPTAGAMCVVVLQTLAGRGGVALTGLTRVSRVAVFVQLTLLAAGAAAATASLMRREHPRLLPLLGLAVNALLIELYWNNRFYALGFDQDAWAPR